MSHLHTSRILLCYKLQKLQMFVKTYLLGNKSNISIPSTADIYLFIYLIMKIVKQYTKKNDLRQVYWNTNCCPQLQFDNNSIMMTCTYRWSCEGSGLGLKAPRGQMTVSLSFALAPHKFLPVLVFDLDPKPEIVLQFYENDDRLNSSTGACLHNFSDFNFYGRPPTEIKSLALTPSLHVYMTFSCVHV